VTLALETNEEELVEERWHLHGRQLTRLPVAVDYRTYSALHTVHFVYVALQRTFLDCVCREEVLLFAALQVVPEKRKWIQELSVEHAPDVAALLDALVEFSCKDLHALDCVQLLVDNVLKIADLLFRKKALVQLD